MAPSPTALGRRFFEIGNASVNRVLLRVARWEPLTPLLGRWVAVLRYTGRRSGRTVTLPVSYKRTDEGLVVYVMAPGAKTWWRNFTGGGGPITATIGSETLTGHAVTRRSPDGAVRVEIDTATPPGTT
ncbi:Arm DNA-binding domain-containing protein [Rhodococcus rhodnii]|uniref:DUF385 domain-containing protein n=1 Tax=Rhodococcus rhodnii LMG 5362 TaxID=1273125 RepID=R7WLV0_9NOCA|nr:Arm DNA-binding domain-containing protein [Rhodococcus rhodnii]EOM74989.1 hypothetical protein Rrhod_3709 [Rhodococcus rhodnii LMG 5362]